MNIPTIVIAQSDGSTAGPPARSPRRPPSRGLSTTAGAADPPQIRITHPFHPLRGQTFRFVVAKSLWGEDRVTFEHPDGGLRSVLVNWTDFVPADPYLSLGQGAVLLSG